MTSECQDLSFTFRKLTQRDDLSGLCTSVFAVTVALPISQQTGKFLNSGFMLNRRSYYKFNFQRFQDFDSSSGTGSQNYTRGYLFKSMFNMGALILWYLQ